jgi:hypothetical protein
VKARTRTVMTLERLRRFMELPIERCWAMEAF